MVKPPARPLIRCAPVCLAAAAFLIGGVALPGVALPGAALAARGAAFAEPAGLPGVPGIPSVVMPDVPGLAPGLSLSEGLLPGIVLPTPVWRHLDPLRAPTAMPGIGGIAQPGDPDGWFDRPDDPAAPEEPAPDEEEPDVRPPAVPEVPAPPVEPMRPTIAPPPPPTAAAPRPAPASPAAPRPSRTPKATPSPADTRGLDELFPDRPSTDTPEAGAPHGSAGKAEPVGYGPPLIYSGIAGMLISAIGIGVVLNRRRGW
ncbi:hypothetical protein Ais01nite_84440 [Asanoa ishikariensis]|uniref:Uncharacterized protein n=1 Tax=Asanoa ishikariensis TaxID=137265 RepID=A0A1H3KCP2_9ACTN|nr:hypothetical protein [Asanoa ishikariensis]GIF70409.1 hypothetical protein Ais01nite_84440 [Asanoa ishikariensis]SDY49916.1 hypothetical protein SAMN05421684_0071 [Asanoa ishikariensis]